MGWGRDDRSFLRTCYDVMSVAGLSVVDCEVNESTHCGRCDFVVWAVSIACEISALLPTTLVLSSRLSIFHRCWWVDDSLLAFGLSGL